uniref:BACK domain-containing protein n=2 Tax=Schistocephalus solidus TaxID=70667 RepID=A0A0V0J253_SCHSO
MMQSVSVLKWPTVSIESASSLIDYLYTGRIEISSDNAMQMILLSKQLSLPWVEDWAVSFLSVRLQNDNLSESWNFATAVNCEGLRDACVHHMKIFFEASVASAFFSELPADVLLSILRDDDLQVDSEEKVFEAIKRWVRPTGTVDEHRIIHAPEMLREVRWSQTKHRFRRRLIEGDDIIVSSAECMQCVGLADHWIGFSILRTQESCPFNTNNRPASLATSVFVFGKSALEDRCLIYQYDLEENSCEELTTVEGLEGATFVSFGGGTDFPNCWKREMQLQPQRCLTDVFLFSVAGTANPVLPPSNPVTFKLTGPKLLRRPRQRTFGDPLRR